MLNGLHSTKSIQERLNGDVLKIYKLSYKADIRVGRKYKTAYLYVSCTI